MWKTFVQMETLGDIGYCASEFDKLKTSLMIKNLLEKKKQETRILEEELAMLKED